MSTLKYVLLEPIGDVALIKINRPEALNSMNVDVIWELSKTIDIVGVDNNIKAVIITGVGEKSFCAGADISYMVNITPIDAEKYASAAQSVLNKIERLEKPVIAAINGFALGGGCELALVCDIRICSSNAKIGQPEVTIGIPPGWGGTQRLLRIIGPAKAKEMIFTGKMINAEEAYSIGLVNDVIKLTQEELLEAASSDGDDEIKRKEHEKELAKILNKKLIEKSLSMAKEITKNSYNAIKTSKYLINKGMDVDIDSGLRMEIYGWALCFAHEDRINLMSAFLNKGKKK
ncbi:MAG TPA: enoyl-CoA hydratase-related protein [Nitrososphaeraceae archaeon]|jgi:3-hydroxypropionyl-coenzyme A dehydratase|nr:enoyl-CoA hydratase-related protein [Nitrososphaeraceae archaeon]